MAIMTHHYSKGLYGIAVFFSAFLLALLSPGGVAAHDVKPEKPLDRRPNLAFIQEEATGFITGSGGKGYEWHFYKNYAYACGRRGFHTFLIANPLTGVGSREQQSHDSEYLPLFIRFRGGGVGYFDDGTYYGNGAVEINHDSPAQTPLDEESADALVARLSKDGLMKKVTADDDANFRILVISYCDHDIYSGVGEKDPGNPFPPVDNPLTADVTEELPRTTDGLLAAKAAFQYTKDMYPTYNREVILYGTSAGGVGVLNFSTSFGRKGIAFGGAISDSGNESPWAEDLVGFGCIHWMQPAESFFSGLVTRIGPYMGPRVNAISTIINQTLTTPIFLIWSRGDKSSCGETEIAIDSDKDGEAELFWPGSEVSWRPLARVIESHNPGGASRWLRVCVDDEDNDIYPGPCDQHSPTLYDKRDTDAIEYDGDYNTEIYEWMLKRIGR